MTSSWAMKAAAPGAILLAVAVFAGLSGAQQFPQDYNLKDLNCAPVSLVVDVGRDAYRLDLSEQAVREATEARLRSARLMKSDASSELVVTLELLKSQRD